MLVLTVFVMAEKPVAVSVTVQIQVDVITPAEPWKALKLVAALVGAVAVTVAEPPVRLHA